MSLINYEIWVKNGGYKLVINKMCLFEHTWVSDKPNEVLARGGILNYSYRDLDMAQRSSPFSTRMRNMIDHYIKSHFILDHDQGCFIDYLELIKVFGVQWRDLITYLISFYGLQRRMGSFWFYRYGKMPYCSILDFYNRYNIYYVEPLHQKRGVHIQQYFIVQITDLNNNYYAI